MKNITLSIEEDVLAGARRYAAAHDSTVNSLVREFLREIASREDRVNAARKKIAELSLRSTARMGRRKWTREELYER